MARLAAMLRDRLAAQAARSPDAIAAEDAQRAVSYAQLHRSADGLAQMLLARGAGRERMVAVRSGMTTDLVIALLAVLRSGAAFVPVDPVHPVAWQLSVIRDSGACLLLSDGGAPLLGGPPLVRISERPADPGRRIPLPDPHPDQAAYILYTSGSTGEPKGVVVSQRALALYLEWAAASYGGAGPVLMHTSAAFDLSMTALFVPLLAGGTVRLASAGDLASLADLLAVRRWALLKLTPSHLSALDAVDRGQPDGAGAAAAPVVDTLVVGGEALRYGQVRRWLAAGTGVFNEYGPTEATVGCCVHRVGAADPDAVPIGEPLPYATVALGNPGGPGELLVGGGGLARGYLGQPALTAARFVPDPAARGARRYRTGDLVSRDGRGALRYHGRLDRQLKIRGHRVEPGEVESALRACQGVAQAAVRGEQAAGRTLLEGYVVPLAGARLSVPALLGDLASRLPAHSVPSRLAILPALPVTAAGKTDYDGLPRAAALAAALDRIEALSDEQTAGLAGLRPAGRAGEPSRSGPPAAGPAR
jgi:amino acid adenylation domain-containing protein